MRKFQVDILLDIKLNNENRHSSTFAFYVHKRRKKSVEGSERVGKKTFHVFSSLLLETEKE